MSRDARTQHRTNSVLPGGIVVFDAVGTLLRPEPAVAEAYAAAGCEFGSGLTRTEIDARFRKVFADEKQADLRDNAGRTDEPRERERWRAVVAAVFDDVALERHDALFERLWHHFAQCSSWRAYEDVGPALQRLIAAGCALAIGSNFDRRLLAIAAALVPEIPPQRVIASSLIGARKPAAEFFRACERQFAAEGLAWERITLVGDDLDEDFRGATQAGWNAILLDRDDRHVEVRPRLTTLDDILSVS